MPHRRRNKSKEDGTSGVIVGPGRATSSSSSTSSGTHPSSHPSTSPSQKQSSRKLSSSQSEISKESDAATGSPKEETPTGLQEVHNSQPPSSSGSETVPQESDKPLTASSGRILSLSTSSSTSNLPQSTSSLGQPSSIGSEDSHEELGATGRTPLAVVEETEDCVFAGATEWTTYEEEISKSYQQESESESESHVICCVPHGSCLVGTPLHLPIDYGDAVKVNCNNENCTQSGFMHRVCFEAWEEHVLTFLKTCGRARSWSDKQRLQNLWTKKGYDLAYRACDCLCEKGHLRKDLDFAPPPGGSEEKERKRNRRRKKSDRTQFPDRQPLTETEKSASASSTLAATVAGPQHPGQGMAGPRGQHLNPGATGGYCLQGLIADSGGGPNIEINHRTSFHRMRTMSQSSGASLQSGDTGVGSCSPPNTTPNNTPTTVAYGHPYQQKPPLQTKLVGANHSPPGMQSNGMQHPLKQLPVGSPPQVNHPMGGAVPRRRINSNPYATNPRTATMMSQSWTPNSLFSSNNPPQHPPNLHPVVNEPRVCPATGNMFQRRKDLSVFHTLPYQKRNPYHVKIDDEGPHGNDDMRNLILASLSVPKVVRVPCGLCGLLLLIYDRFPLIDGTFYLSPVQHRHEYVAISHHQNNNGGDYGGKSSFYLTAVCMSCLEGDNDIRCKFCLRRWDGSWHVLGTMYSYDIFAAVPCCAPRLSCNKCQKPIVDPKTKLQFFSDYSRMLECPHCNTVDFHFVKPLNSYQLIRKN